MSDPNYAHEFEPSRKGKCKQIVSSRICGLGEDAPVHTRYKEADKPLDALRDWADEAVSKILQESQRQSSYSNLGDLPKRYAEIIRIAHAEAAPAPPISDITMRCEWKGTHEILVPYCKCGEPWNFAHKCAVSGHGEPACGCDLSVGHLCDAHATERNKYVGAGHIEPAPGLREATIEECARICEESTAGDYARTTRFTMGVELAGRIRAALTAQVPKEKKND